jgi:IMP dehydrogenase
MAIKSKFYGEGLTFDDVLLMPAYSEVLPREVSIITNLTKDIRINIPMVSAAMDTVTETPLAIALSREGGIGILPQKHEHRAPGRAGAQSKTLRERPYTGPG